jgi:mRNA interferase RelE/StbE
VAWIVKLTPGAERQLDRLDPRVGARIRARLRDAAEGDPYLGAGPLRGELRTLYRYRVSKWRVIVDIRRRELVVLVLDVGRRDTIYK